MNLPFKLEDYEDFPRYSDTMTARWIEKFADNKLKECPFCGGLAAVYVCEHMMPEQLPTQIYYCFRVTCTKCWISQYKGSNTKGEAINDWNERANSDK